MLHFWIGAYYYTRRNFDSVTFSWIYDGPNQTWMLNKNFALCDKKTPMNRKYANFMQTIRWFQSNMMARTSALSVSQSSHSSLENVCKNAGFRSINLLELSSKWRQKIENSCSKDNWDDLIYIILYLSNIPVTFNSIIVVIYPIYFILY